MSKKIDRVGEYFITNEGYKIVIVEYNNNKDITVEFQDEHGVKVSTDYSTCKNGKIKNPYHPSVFGVGYIGVGKYKTSINYEKTECYKDWQSMLKRAYDNKEKQKHPTYKDVTVNKELHCFQNFAKWWYDNYYEVGEEVMCLDKDILIKGNKEYSPNTMIFVPQRINKLFEKSDRIRGDLPIGVCFNKNNNKYVANCKVDGKTKYLGSYNTSHQAFLAYKEFKEQYIKEIANAYKDVIPKQLYEAMYRWEVEITD